MFKVTLMVLSLAILSIASANSFTNVEITPLIGEDAIRNVVKGVTDRLFHGIPSMGIPKLEPFEKKGPIPLDIDNDLAKINGSISDILINGVRGLVLPDVEIKLGSKIQIMFRALIPEVKLYTKFKLKGTLGGLFPIDGDGYIDLTIHTIKIRAKGKLLSKDEKPYLTELEVTPSIDKLTAKIHNLVPNKDVNDFIEKGLNEIGPELVTYLWGKYGVDALDQIEEISKKFMEKFTFKEFVEIILGKSPFKPGDPEPNCPDGLV